MSTTVRKTTILTLALALALMFGVLAMFGGKPASAQEAGPPSGDDIQPEFVAGNPSCSSLGLGDFELKVEPVADGTYSDGTLTVNVDVRDTTAGPVFDWTSDLGVDAVIVKGGPNANSYVYDPPQEDTGDTDLHAPVNRLTTSFSGSATSRGSVHHAQTPRRSRLRRLHASQAGYPRVSTETGLTNLCDGGAAATYRNQFGVCTCIHDREQLSNRVASCIVFGAAW
jgi:hypothetical protein